MHAARVSASPMKRFGMFIFIPWTDRSIAPECGTSGENRR